MMPRLHFGGAQRLPMLQQTEAAECGLACLAMISSYHGQRVDMNTLRRRYPVSLKGVTLRGLIQIANHMDLACRALRFELDHLPKLRLPAILHWDMNHFVVLKAVRGSRIIIHDPAAGERSLAILDASKHLSGIALEVTPADAFSPKDERVRLPFSAFWTRVPGMNSALVQILALSAVLQLLVLAGPFYMQITIDEVIGKGDIDLLVALAFGFGLLMLLTVATTAIRSLIILILQNTLQFQLAGRLFHHLIRLPLAYFEKRHIGDILSRFTSLEPIRNLIAQGLVTAVIDGLMAIATLVMLFIYSPLLAWVVLAALALYLVLRLAMFRMLRRRTEAAIQSKAQEHSTFIESMRAIQSLKLFNRESDRENQWLNRHAEFVNASVRLGRAQVTFKTANDAIFGLENIVIVYLAARLALGGNLTVGMIFAFMAYKRHFIDKTVQLVERLIEFLLLDLHLERLADIALNPVEKGHDRPLAAARPVTGQIALRGLGFRYAESEPFIFRNIDITIEPGQFVTIIGPSGSGKTTLLKVMIGLLEPSEGEILIDGTPLASIGARSWRENVGAVMQDDQLLSGSVAENITFFDATVDEARMVECAEIACIHDEISAMPMGYNSLIGDMGSSLSGGQKQRVLLARALYRRPQVLVLDEGTAHLDVATERLINQRLRTLNLTRISVAHRPEMMSGADRIVRIDGNTVTELPAGLPADPPAVT
jgi:ATP-binding cassette, subfamily B, bacterial CvaB/MchF/RaxB